MIKLAEQLPNIFNILSNYLNNPSDPMVLSSESSKDIEIWISSIQHVTKSDLDNCLTQLKSKSSVSISNRSANKIKAFVFQDDKVRALLSELLQQSLMTTMHGSRFNSIARTKEVSMFCEVNLCIRFPISL